MERSVVGERSPRSLTVPNHNPSITTVPRALVAVLLGVIICAAFVTFWVRAGAIVASGPEGAGPGAEHPLLGVPGLVGLILGRATGVTLITLGLWRILRKLSRRGSGNAPHAHIPALHRARPVFGSAATHLMLGVVGVGPRLPRAPAGGDSPVGARDCPDLV